MWSTIWVTVLVLKTTRSKITYYVLNWKCEWTGKYTRWNLSMVCKVHTAGDSVTYFPWWTMHGNTIKNIFIKYGDSFITFCLHTKSWYTISNISALINVLAFWTTIKVCILRKYCKENMWVLCFPHHKCWKGLSNQESKRSDLEDLFGLEHLQNLLLPFYFWGNISL